MADVCEPDGGQLACVELTGMADVREFGGLAAEIWRRPARLGRVRLVAVDGGTGAGKTRFAQRLARVFTASRKTTAVVSRGIVPAAGQRARGPVVTVVHIDDLLDGWADQFTFWPRLERDVLAPLRAGVPGRHQCYDWLAGRFGRERMVAVPDVLIIEGVTAARQEARGQATLSVFLVADPQVRLARVLCRDGAHIALHLRRWMAAESEFFARDRTPARVDVLVAGAPTVEHDPETEYVRARW